MRVSCRHWSVKIGAVFFIQERRTKMGKRDKEIPYEVVIQERKRVDLYGNVVYYIYWFDKYGYNITNEWKFWSKGPKKKYDRVNRYLTDSWLKEYCKNNNLKISRIKNTGKIIDYFDGSFMHAICSNCENEVIISNIEEVKHEIDLRFHEFVERTGKEPEYVECQIVRKETGDEQRKTMKLSLNINDDDNDDVFCYCNGIESFKQLAEYGMGEFIVTFCWSFF